MTNFTELGLIPELLKAVQDSGYEKPTPIQSQSIPILLTQKDLLGCAQTGTGKTAAFSLPLLQLLASQSQPVGRRMIRALVLSPTRELAAQIGDCIAKYRAYLSIKELVIFGGVNEKPQIEALDRGIDILIATPGRLLDLQGKGHIDLSHVAHFVLDEADLMLDMGFIHDIRRILALVPKKKQSLLFSATMPQRIVDLASHFLHEPMSVSVTPESTTADRVTQKVMFLEKNTKRHLLIHLLKQPQVHQSIVFTRTKHGANRLTQHLNKADISALAIHGNKSQNARTRALSGFRDGSVSTLVATDIAARGIDVEGVSHVFNYELPNEPESYVHRIGRTGRAGESGEAIALCCAEEGAYLRNIEATIGFSIPVDRDHQWHVEDVIPPLLDTRKGRSKTRTNQSTPPNRTQRRKRSNRSASQRKASHTDSMQKSTREKPTREKPTREKSTSSQATDQSPHSRRRRSQRHRRSNHSS